LAAVRAGLTLLEVQVFEEEGFDLVTGFGLPLSVHYQSENIRIMLDDNYYSPAQPNHSIVRIIPISCPK